MSTIIGNPITLGGGGTKLNIDYGQTPPTDTSKLWVPLSGKPDNVECSPVISFGSEVFSTEQGSFSGNLAAEAQQNNIVGTKIYQFCGVFGGLNKQSKVFWYDFSTKQTGQIAISNVSAKSESTSVSVGTKIYSFGGLTATNSTYNYIDVFDTSTEAAPEVIKLSGTVVGTARIAMFSTYKDGKIYFGGGNAGSATSSAAIYSLDISTNAVEKAFSTFKAFASHSSAIFVGDDLYIVGCNSSSVNSNSKVFKVNLQSQSQEEFLQLPGNYYAPVVACFDNRYIYVLGGTPTTSVTAPSLKIDTVTKTYEQLSDNFNTYAFGVAYGISGNKIYILGGSPSYQLSPITNAIRSFTAQSDLQSNHLLLQEDYGFDGLWSALKSKDTDLKVKVINAYLGDSNNIAQLTNAYLYDTASQSWKSLSGESYVADMQNALNILGVT